MGRIRKLSQQVVNQIAAGEVVERPASVVKELLENAVDAQAATIELSVVEGGKSLIRVSDDGIGMDAEDLALAFESHATSKLSRAEDLFAIVSMGFRGEALASIGSIADVRIVSRPREADSGCEVHAQGGVISAVKPAARAVGTTVEVRDLFAPVPVRRKFLRATATEFGHVSEALHRIALAQPQIGFRFHHGTRQVSHLSPGEDLRARIAAFFGAEMAEDLIAVESALGHAAVHGLIAPPRHHRANQALVYCFLNGRYIRDRALLHAVGQGFAEYLPPGRHPICFLTLHLDPAQVDVNVHPTKIEVRFRHGNVFHEMIRTALAGALRRGAGTARLPIDPHAPVRSPRDDVREGERFEDGADASADYRRRIERAVESLLHEGPRRTAPAPARAHGESGASPLFSRPETSAAPPGSAPTTAPESGPPGGANPPSQADLGADAELAALSDGMPARVMQVADSYLVFESDEGLRIIDQHALHERLLYHQLRDRFEESGLEAQRLMAPVLCELSAREAALIEKERDTLARLGFEVETLRGGTVAINTVPVLAARCDPVTFLHDFCAEHESGPSAKNAPFLERMLDSMACKSAIRAGDPLSGEAIDALLGQIAQAKTAYACPHGRPTTLTIAWRDLERHFLRR